MPFKTYRRPVFPVESPGDVAALVELLVPAATDEQLRNTLCDHFAYVAGAHPEWFRPHQERVILELLGGFSVTFDTMSVLFRGAPDNCVEHLIARPRLRLDALAAIGTEPALTAAADLARGQGDASELEDIGFWTPPSGPLRQRFSSHRLAVERRPVADLAGLLAAEHPVGLPLDRVVRDPETTPVSWHFLSLRAAALPGVPAWPADLLHLVETNLGWGVTGAVGEDGRWHGESVEAEGAPDDEDERVNDEGDGRAMVVLRPYDDTLLYCNSHIMSTPDVFGTVGGPPIGVYSNPSCRSCHRLMFHVATVTNHIRGDGDGFRSLYICEDCHLTTSAASNWN
ncbi:hypothetical protein [Dactylosporangium sp. NPDC000521]|uniref:hypothetical protein n=1 Tax=Dactylosporangium sp. NPDC000521 TaxID=3363975 RepID=UPI0036A80FD4